MLLHADCIKSGQFGSYEVAIFQSGESDAQGTSGSWRRFNLLGMVSRLSTWRPTIEQSQSAAFKVIVGEAKYTEGGLRGTILDATETGLLEIKGGSSVLNSTYQLRLQTYRFHVENAERAAKNLPPLSYTIRTTRPVNPTFRDWLQRWGVKVERIE